MKEDAYNACNLLAIHVESLSRTALGYWCFRIQVRTDEVAESNLVVRYEAGCPEQRREVSYQNILSSRHLALSIRHIQDFCCRELLFPPPLQISIKALIHLTEVARGTEDGRAVERVHDFKQSW